MPFFTGSEVPRYVLVTDRNGETPPAIRDTIVRVLYEDGYWTDVRTSMGEAYSLAVGQATFTPATLADWAALPTPEPITHIGYPTIDRYGRRMRSTTRQEWDLETGRWNATYSVDYLDAEGNVIPEPPIPEMRTCQACGRNARVDENFRRRNVTCNDCIERRREARRAVREHGRRFGVEIEFCAEVERESASYYGNSYGMLPIETIADALREAGLSVYSERYTHTVMSEWKLILDASVDDGYELVSPPLRWDERDQVATACKVLSNLGCSASSSCGLHVHHEVSDMSMPRLRNVIQHWHEAQPLTDCLVDYSRRDGNSQWCSRFTEHELDRLMRAQTPDSFERIDRYKALNVSCFSNYGTFEIRQHEGTIDSAEILAWVAYGQAFIEHASRQALPKLKATAHGTVDGTHAESVIDMLPIRDDTCKAHLKRAASREASRVAASTGFSSGCDDYDDEPW